MDFNLGKKIRELRKERNISQDVLAQYLGVSFQAVSKWENGITLPDVTMIPAIASFFHVSTDELFDFNTLEQEKRVEEICTQAYAYRGTDNQKSEAILRDGLRKFPGNDIILNNLLYTMRSPQRYDEVIALCTVLIEGAKHDDVRYDALRILAETYQEKGEYALCKSTIERIPEFYFSKLELDALLLEGEDMYKAAWAQKYIAAENLVNMYLRLAEYYDKKNEPNHAEVQRKIAKNIILTMKEDLKSSPESEGFYEGYGKDILERLCHSSAASPAGV